MSHVPLAEMHWQLEQEVEVLLQRSEKQGASDLTN